MNIVRPSTSDDWRQAIRNSVKGNYDYLFPLDPQPASQPAETPVNCHSERSEESASSSNSSLATRHSSLPQQPVPQPAETPINCHSERSEESASSSNSSLATRHSPLPPQPAASPHTSLPPTSAEFVQHVMAGLQTGGAQAPHPAPAAQPAPAPQPPETPVNCQSERSEESASSSNSSLATRHSSLPPQPAQATPRIIKGRPFPSRLWLLY